MYGNNVRMSTYVPFSSDILLRDQYCGPPNSDIVLFDWHHHFGGTYYLHAVPENGSSTCFETLTAT